MNLTILFSLVQDVGGFEDSVDNLLSTIKKVFPLIMLAIFLVGFMFNAGHFFGENADLKKGIARLLVFVGILATVGGIATYILSLVL